MLDPAAMQLDKRLDQAKPQPDAPLTELVVARRMVERVKPSEKGLKKVLLVARVVQASGTAIMMPLLMTTLMIVVPAHARGRMMGRVSIVMSLAPAIGPTLSGFLLDTVGWRLLSVAILPLTTSVSAGPDGAMTDAQPPSTDRPKIPVPAANVSRRKSRRPSFEALGMASAGCAQSGVQS